MTDDRRLIEDYLPIEAISAEASREKSVRKGHISTLHLWWARRPLVACRAAVYGALVPASRFIPKNGPDNKKQSLGRANAAKFIERLCKYPGSPQVIAEAQQHILEAHAERLSKERGTGFQPVSKQVRFEVVESVGQAASLSPEQILGFDPAGFSKGGNATCPFCGTVADSDYVKAEGCAKRMGQRMMAIVCTHPGRQGKVYLSVEQASSLSGEDLSAWKADPLLDPNVRRQSELAAEDMVVAALKEEGFPEDRIERVGHLKLGFDIRAHRIVDEATGEVLVKRVEVKGRVRAQPVRLTTNEWYKAQQLAETYWLYVVWDPLGPYPELVRIQNPAVRLDHAKREIVAARFLEIPAEAIDSAARSREKGSS